MVLSDLDEAADLVVSGGDVTTAEAAAIQQISEYNESGSDYEITDNAAAVIGAGDSVIEDDRCNARRGYRMMRQLLRVLT